METFPQRSKSVSIPAKHQCPVKPEPASPQTRVSLMHTSMRLKKLTNLSASYKKGDPNKLRPVSQTAQSLLSQN